MVATNQLRIAELLLENLKNLRKEYRNLLEILSVGSEKFVF